MDAYSGGGRMIAKISILISIVVSTINVILLMRLYQEEYDEEYDDDEELYQWAVAIKKDGKVIFFEAVMAKTSEEALAIARAKAGVVEGDGHKWNCVGPFK